MDLAVIETGNGGDIQLEGNDLALVFGIENMPYLGMFGGNPLQSTNNTVTEEQSLDWWGNSLFMPSSQSNQFNSTVERIINTTPLTSAGRIVIENAIKDDLDFLTQIAFQPVDVTVTIVDTDRINVKLVIQQLSGAKKVTVINFRKQSNGDFYIFDFNDDFYL
jgi:hypothetical protein